MMLNMAHQKARICSSRISWGSFAAPLLTENTTAILSHQHCTFDPAQRGAHSATAMMIGTNSLGLMGTSFQDGGQDSWNHLLSDVAPHPQEPEASDTRVNAGLSGGKTLTHSRREGNCSTSKDRLLLPG